MKIHSHQRSNIDQSQFDRKNLIALEISFHFSFARNCDKEEKKVNQSQREGAVHSSSVSVLTKNSWLTSFGDILATTDGANIELRFCFIRVFT